METFQDLINQYIQRIGISDAELARFIGVRRQTIFRWREGLTARHRDDILAVSKKLRLTDEEQDKLLLAAGFRPENPPPLDDLLSEARLIDETASSPEETLTPETSSPDEASAANIDLTGSSKSQGLDNLSGLEREVQPETIQIEDAEMIEADIKEPQTERVNELVKQPHKDMVLVLEPSPSRLSRRWWSVIGVLLILGILGSSWVMYQGGREGQNFSSFTPEIAILPPTPFPPPVFSTPTAHSVWVSNQNTDVTTSIVTLTSIRVTTATSATATVSPSQTVQVRTTKILITQFTNYGGDQLGYNVAGRLQEALQEEIAYSGFDPIAIDVWPKTVAGSDQALQVAQETRATLVIYGEYDAGRVLVKFAHSPNESQATNDDQPIVPPLQRYVADLKELSATLNTDLPQEIRSLALLALGRIYISQDELGHAQIFLTQSQQILRKQMSQDEQPSVDQKTWALVNLYLGLVHHYSHPPEWDQAIDAYSEAVEAWPELITPRLNRGLAYEKRRRPGDLGHALSDVNAVIALKSDWSSAYNNRASLRTRLGGANNLALALADLDKAIHFKPDQALFHFNRAYVRYVQGELMKDVASDLEKAIALRPSYSAALNFFCWGYAVENQAEKALPYCEQAVEFDPHPVFRDSRGVTYALLGDYDSAIADLQAYLDWLEMQPDQIYQAEAERRRAWIAALAAGESPFTPTVLSALREEFGPG